jgi:hypothetical protein
MSRNMLTATGQAQRTPVCNARPLQYWRLTQNQQTRALKDNMSGLSFSGVDFPNNLTAAAAVNGFEPVRVPNIPGARWWPGDEQVNSGRGE